MTDTQQWTIKNRSDLKGWEILFVEPYGPSQVRLHLVKEDQVPYIFRLGYCEKALL